MSEYQSLKEIISFLDKNKELNKYKNMFLEFHKTENFNPFFTKLKKAYSKDKSDKSILNELRTAYNLKKICGFHVIFMLEKDVGEEITKLKQGSYMIFKMPEGIETKDLAKIKKPDLLAFFKGKPFYIEVKTIRGKIKNHQQILKKIPQSILQIEKFGNGLIQIFCDRPEIQKIDELVLNISKKIEKRENIFGVLLTYYKLFSEQKLSEYSSQKTFRQETKCILNKNFLI